MDSDLQSAGQVSIAILDKDDMAPSPNSTSIYFCPKVSAKILLRLEVTKNAKKDTMSQSVVFTDADTTSDPLYISASIAEEQNELPSVIDGLRINANGELLISTQRNELFSLKVTQSNLCQMNQSNQAPVGVSTSSMVTRQETIM